MPSPSSVVPTMKEFVKKVLPFFRDHWEIPLEDYNPGRVSYDWTSPTGPEYLYRNSQEYEEELESFILRDYGSEGIPYSRDLLVLVGGIGTGKSTLLSYTYRRIFMGPRKCSRSQTVKKICDFEPNFIKFDFDEYDTTIPLSEDKQLEALWNYFAVRIRDEIKTLDNEIEEVGGFWYWCLHTKKILVSSPELHKFFNRLEHKITCLAKNRQYTSLNKDELIVSLTRERDELFKSFSSHAHAWYVVLLLNYNIHNREGSCRCLHLIFDNVDHIYPDLQSTVVEFAAKVTSLLGARGIISIRPLTWTASLHANKLLPRQHHFAPDAIGVINSRINKCIASGDLTDTEVAALQAIKNNISRTRPTILRTMLTVSSGISVRFCLRNFQNMLLSPHLYEGTIDSEFLSPNNIKISDLAKAFFFGDLGSMRNDSFDNIYQTKHQNRVDYILVKPRILDFMYRVSNYIAEIVDVFDFAMRFYDKSVIKTALDEMLRRSRPLLWSEDGFTIKDVKSKGRIMVTPIGKGYYEKFFGEYFYDEICINSKSITNVTLREVYDFHTKLTDRDLIEIESYSARYGSISYRSIYPPDMPGMSYLHWKNLKVGFKWRYTNARSEIVYDPQREEWLSAKIKVAVDDR